jgi:asparagine N-glycosylation enzyme membrane subunit Stt3
MIHTYIHRWDYGYQITGIGERTTLADGNTWNHEHIATIGKMMASPEQVALVISCVTWLPWFLSD